jgi:hypothetical protein
MHTTQYLFPLERIQKYSHIMIIMNLVPFFAPPQLMKILSDPANEECIAWLPHGCSFRVHNSARFLGEILPPYYKNKKIKYTSFTRKLSRWDFVRLSSGPDTGAFYHKLFQRDKPDLARRMFCKGERNQFPRNLGALTGLPQHMQATVAAGLPGTFGGMGWNAALGMNGGFMPQPQAQDRPATEQSQQLQQPTMQQPMMQQQQPMDPMQFQLQMQQQLQNFATPQGNAGGTMVANNCSHSTDDSKSNASDQQSPALPTTNNINANPAGMAIEPVDMKAFLTTINNSSIDPAIKAQMLAQQQALLEQQQLILQQQLAASGINVSLTPNQPITVPTAPAHQQEAEPLQMQQMSLQDFLAAQAAPKLDTSYLQFTPKQGQPSVGEQKDSASSAKRAWAA